MDGKRGPRAGLASLQTSRRIPLANLLLPVALAMAVLLLTSGTGFALGEASCEQYWCPPTGQATSEDPTAVGEGAAPPDDSGGATTGQYEAAPAPVQYEQPGPVQGPVPDEEPAGDVAPPAAQPSQSAVLDQYGGVPGSAAGQYEEPAPTDEPSGLPQGLGDEPLEDTAPEAGEAEEMPGDLQEQPPVSDHGADGADDPLARGEEPAEGVEEHEVPADWYYEDPTPGDHEDGSFSAYSCYDQQGAYDPSCGLDGQESCSVYGGTIEGFVKGCIAGPSYESGNGWCQPVSGYDMDEGEKLGDYTLCKAWEEHEACGDDQCGVKQAPPEGWECARVQKDFGTLYEEQETQIVCVSPENWVMCPGHDTYDNPTATWVYDESGNLIERNVCDKGDGNYASWLAGNADPADDTLSQGHGGMSQGPEGVQDGPDAQRPSGGGEGDGVDLQAWGQGGFGRGGGPAEPFGGTSEAAKTPVAAAPSSPVRGVAPIGAAGVTGLSLLASEDVARGRGGSVVTYALAEALRSPRASDREGFGAEPGGRVGASRSPGHAVGAASVVSTRRDPSDDGSGLLPGVVGTFAVDDPEPDGVEGKEASGRGSAGDEADGRGWASFGSFVPVAVLGTIGAVLLARRRYAS